MNKSCVVQDWVFTHCSWREQTVLMTAIRGPDGMPKHNSGKILSRTLRYDVLKDATPGRGTFMHEPSKGEEDLGKLFLADHDGYPHHFIMHLIHAAEIIGYNHPKKIISDFWKSFYKDACEAFHMNPETKEQMKKRLQDDI